MFDLIKEVGRGKKGAKNLSYEQARKGALQMVSGQATPAQIGAFLIAERIKTETPEEILAFVDVLRDRASGIPSPMDWIAQDPMTDDENPFLPPCPPPLFWPPPASPSRYTAVARFRRNAGSPPWTSSIH